MPIIEYAFAIVAVFGAFLIEQCRCWRRQNSWRKGRADETAEVEVGTEAASCHLPAKSRKVVT